MGNFFHELKSIQENANCHTIIVTGDINFNTTDWQSMTANTDYELVCLDILLDHDYTEMLNKGGTQLNVLLCNNPDTVSSTRRDRWLTARYKTNETLCSDHSAYWTNLECTTPSANKPPKIVYAFKKADFKKLNDSIIKNPFTPFCYSNVDHLVHSWYEWIRNLIDKNIPRITKHRATLPPWISNATCHLLKQLQTLNRRKNLYSVSHQLKVRQMERKISAAAEKDLEAFEALVNSAIPVNNSGQISNSQHRHIQISDSYIRSGQSWAFQQLFRKCLWVWTSDWKHGYLWKRQLEHLKTDGTLHQIHSQRIGNQQSKWTGQHWKHSPQKVLGVNL